MKRRILAMLLSVTIVATALSGCGNSGQTASNEPAESKESEENGDEGEAGEAVTDQAGEEAADESGSGELVRLQILDMPANESGVQTGWYHDYIKEKINVEVELLPTGDQGEQKLQALMASGELPDIVVFKDDKQVVNAVTGDMLLAYDDYKDLVPNLYKNAATSLKYYADNVSNGQGKSYAVGTELKNALETATDSGGFSLRYDLYKQIGAPEVSKVEDFLPVIKQMQELAPENEDGKKVYGISIWKDWDRSYMTLGMFFAPYTGCQIPNEGCLAQINFVNNEEISSILDEDSAYMKFLRFMFEANQMGLVDPDSMTQRFSDATQKTMDGRVIFQFGDWGTYFPNEQLEQGIGFRQIVAQDEKFLVDNKNEIGKGWSVAVSKASKHPEEAMKFVNLLYDYETAMVEQNGPKGEAWDVDENGKPYVTEAGYTEWYNSDTRMSYEEKGNDIFRGFASYSINSDMGCTISHNYWDEPDYAPKATKLVQEWRDDFGYKTVLEYQYSLDNIIVKSFVPQPTLTDEMEQISTRVGDVIKTNSWKMVFAKDQAEFDSLYQDMLEKAEGMGINDFVEWYAEEYAKNKDFAAQYIN